MAKARDDEKPAETLRIRLNHNCGIPGAEGLPGDEIDVERDLATKIIGRGGAEVVVPGVAPRASKPSPPAGDLIARLDALETRCTAAEAALARQAELSDAQARDLAALRAQLGAPPAK